MNFELKRNSHFDLLRLIAICSVVVIHQKFDLTQDQEATYLRLYCRWCVPFFFMLTGFYLQSADGLPKVDIKRIQKIVFIAVAANVLYFPLSVVMNGLEAFTINAVVVGTWYHLWFFSSLILALLIFLSMPEFLRNKGALFALMAVTISCEMLSDVLVTLDPIKFEGVFGFFRHLSGAAYLYLGFLISQAKFKTNSLSAIGIVVLGVLLTATDAIVLSLYGYSSIYRQMPIGAAFIAVGLLLWCRQAVSGNNFIRMLSGIGRNHSLVIYVVHPIFLKIGDIVLPLMKIGEARPYIGIVFAICASIGVSVGMANLRKLSFIAFRNDASTG